MSDLITRKPTAPMTELLRKGAASPKGIMTLSDHNDRTQDGILRREMADVVAEPGATHSWLVINDRGRAYLARLDGAQQQAPEEAVSAPQAFRHDPYAPTPGIDADGRAYAVGDAVESVGRARTGARRGLAAEEGTVTAVVDGRPVVRFTHTAQGEEVDVRPDLFRIVPQEAQEAPQTAAQRPALADLAKVSEEPVRLGQGAAAVERPSLVVVAYGSSHHFADVDGTWVEVCGRCGGEGTTPFKWVHKGVCYGCNGSGLLPDVFTGTREQRDAFVYSWALRKERERVAAEKRAAKIHAKRVAAWQRWEAANGELITWCRSLTPDRIEEYDESRQSLADTREEAERLYGEGETLVRSGQYEDGVHAGRWWADFHVVYRSEVFNSYGHRAANLIKEVREGHEPLDGRGTALLTKIMRSAVQAAATSRYAGPVDAEVTVTGRVKRVKIVDGFNSWSPSRRMIVLEGTGEHAGVTVTAYSGSAAAKALEEGQEGVTVTGVVSKHKEYSGSRETAVARPRISA